jgi:hypothetical protein
MDFLEAIPTHAKPSQKLNSLLHSMYIVYGRYEMKRRQKMNFSIRSLFYVPNVFSVHNIRQLASVV